MRRLFPLLVLLLAAAPALPGAPTAGADPWSTAVTNLATLFTGPIVRGLSLVAVVLAGLYAAFGEGGQQKGKIAGLIFGLGMALLAAQFLNWITGTTIAATIEPAPAAAVEAAEEPPGAGAEEDAGAGEVLR